MKMKKLFYLVVLLGGMGISAFAQKPYQRGIGLRIAPSSYYDVVSATYKFFVSDAGAIDLNAGVGFRHQPYYDNLGNRSDVRPFTLAVSAAYLHHFEIPVRGGGFTWFLGGGLTVYNAFFSKKGDYNGVGFGIFPTGGVDFKIPHIPLAVSADYRPTIFFTQPNYYDSFYGSNFGLSARYTIGER